MIELNASGRSATPHAIISGRSVPLWHLLSPAAILRTCWRYRDLLRQLTWREVTMRYRGSRLGLLWSLVLPLLMLAVYTFVFSVVFQAKWGVGAGNSTAEFAVTMYCGVVVFGIFSEPVSRCASIVTANTLYVKKVVFPLEVLPLVVLGSVLVHAAAGLAVLLIAVVLVNGTLSASVFLIPIALAPLLLLTLGLSWFVASLGVYVRDVSQVVGVLTQVLMFLTPVFYPASAVPERFRWAIELNPLAGVVEDARRSLLWGMQLDWITWSVTLAVSIAVMQLGYAWFMKTKRGFADVL